jgi:predicted nuclease with TOPRIM domain
VKEKEEKKKKKQLLAEVEGLQAEVTEYKATIESLRARLTNEKAEADRLRTWWFVLSSMLLGLSEACPHAFHFLCCLPMCV